MSEHAKRPILLLLDWDGTLTTASTLPFIASIATLPEIHPSLEDLSAAYSNDLKRHNDLYVPQQQERTTLQQELAYLSSLTAVEQASVERVEASGIFKDIRQRDADLAAARAFKDGAVILRSGCLYLLEAVQRRKGSGIAIVSVAWSRRFISSTLREVNKASGHCRVAVGEIIVRANEIANDGSGNLDRSLGAERRGIWTAADKSAVIEDLIDEACCTKSAYMTHEHTKPVTIYIGDSPTDLPCLLKADVGICIRDSTLTPEQMALTETLQRLGIDCLNVFRYDPTAIPNKKTLWWASDFDEVIESGLLDSEGQSGEF